VNELLRPYFMTQGPKRLRRTRRELPEGQISQYGTCWGNFKREREAKLAPQVTDWEITEDRDARTVGPYSRADATDLTVDLYTHDQGTQ
jgi:hypothetical protein